MEAVGDAEDPATHLEWTREPGAGDLLVGQDRVGGPLAAELVDVRDHARQEVRPVHGFRSEDPVLDERIELLTGRDVLCGDEHVDGHPAFVRSVANGVHEQEDTARRGDREQHDHHRAENPSLHVHLLLDLIR